MANDSDVTYDDQAELKLKLTSIRRIVRSFELRLKGHKWGLTGSDFGYTGDVMSGDIVIQKAIGLLQPFCDEANLITIKSDKMFSKQKYRVRCVMNSTLLAEGCSLAQNYSAIMQMFDDTLQNVGDIILGSGNYLKNTFGVDAEEKEVKQF